MMLTEPQRIVFKKKSRTDFEKDLLKRVENYFRDKGISKKGNSFVFVKGIVAFVLALAAYSAIYLVPSTLGWLALCYILVGIFSSIMVFNLGHDALHGALSQNKKINQLMGYTWNLVGMSGYVWNLRHNMAHHSFTNVPGTDHDVAQTPLIRLDPTGKRRRLHKFQHFYAPLILSLVTINLVFIKDFQMLKMTRFGNKDVKHTSSSILKVVLLKVFYVSYMIVLPLIFVKAAFWVILLAFVFKHLATGLFAAAVLLPVHLHPESHFSEPGDDGIIDHSWLSHQLDVTVDFSANTPFVGWITGGLNYHTVHHMFPGICHVHYGPLTKIIRETAEEYEMPYNNKSWGRVIVDSMEMIKILGQKDDMSDYIMSYN